MAVRKAKLAVVLASDTDCGAIHFCRLVYSFNGNNEKAVSPEDTWRLDVMADGICRWYQSRSADPEILQGLDKQVLDNIGMSTQLAVRLTVLEPVFFFSLTPSLLFTGKLADSVRSRVRYARGRRHVHFWAIALCRSRPVQAN